MCFEDNDGLKKHTRRFALVKWLGRITAVSQALDIAVDPPDSMVEGWNAEDLFHGSMDCRRILRT